MTTFSFKLYEAVQHRRSPSGPMARRWRNGCRLNVGAILTGSQLGDCSASEIRHDAYTVVAR